MREGGDVEAPAERERRDRNKTETRDTERETGQDMQSSTRPCKPEAQQTVGGLHQHPGQEGRVRLTHTQVRNTLTSRT